jgi:hypothetical protein
MKRLTRLTCLAALAVTSAAACVTEAQGPRPDAPTVVGPDGPVNTVEVLLRGTKPAGTAVLQAGTTLVPLDGETTWLATVRLGREGVNEYVLVAEGVDGQRSDDARITVHLDTMPPTQPTVVVPTLPTFNSSWTVTGNAEDNAAVRVNGALAEEGTDSDWQSLVALEIGDNEIRVTAADELGNESEAVVRSIERAVYAFSVDPWPSLVADDELALTGTRGPGVAVHVDGMQMLGPADVAGSWQLTLSLDAEGANQRTVAGYHPERSDEVQVSAIRDLTPPAAPQVNALPTIATTTPLTITGSTDPNAALLLDGVVVAPQDGVAGFSIDVPLVPGANTFALTAVDAAGNEGDATSPAPSIYYAPGGVTFEVEPPPSYTSASQLTLSGVRGGDVAVWLRGGEVLPASGSTTWSAPVTLQSGLNSITVEGHVAGHVEQRVIEVTLLDSTPVAPVVTAPAYSDSADVTVTGTRTAETAVFREDGSPVAPADGSTTWMETRSLVEGSHTLSYVVRDPLGQQSATGSASVVVDLTDPTTAIDGPLAGEVVGDVIQLHGTTTDVGGVDYVEVCFDACPAPGDWVRAAGDSVWSINLDVSAEDASHEGLLVTLRARAVDLAGNVGPETTVDARLVRQPRVISENAAFSEASTEVDIDLGPGRELAIVFDAPDGAGGSEIWMRYDTDGDAVAASYLVSEHASLDVSTQPRVAVTAAGAHVVFLDDGAAGATGSPGLVHVADTGTLAAPDVVQPVGGVFDPALASNGLGDVAAVWTRDPGAGATVVELSVRDSGTGLWSAPLVVADDADADSSAPGRASVAIDDAGLIHVLWEDAGDLDGSADDVDIYYRRVTLPNTLGAKQLVSADGATLTDGDSRRPRVAQVSGDADNLIWVSWVERGAINSGSDGVAKVALAAVDDAGVGDPEDASNVAGRGDAEHVDLAVGADRAVHLVWGDDGDLLSSGTDTDVFLRSRTVALQALVPISDPDGDATSTGASRFPRVAVDDVGNRHVVWIEASDLAGTIADAQDRDVFYFALGGAP